MNTINDKLTHSLKYVTCTMAQGVTRRRNDIETERRTAEVRFNLFPRPSVTKDMKDMKDIKDTKDMKDMKDRCGYRWAGAEMVPARLF